MSALLRLLSDCFFALLVRDGSWGWEDLLFRLHLRLLSISACVSFGAMGFLRQWTSGMLCFVLDGTTPSDGRYGSLICACHHAPCCAIFGGQRASHFLGPFSGLVVSPYFRIPAACVVSGFVCIPQASRSSCYSWLGGYVVTTTSARSHAWVCLFPVGSMARLYASLHW